MPERPITDLKNRYRNQTLYVLGSGPTLDHFPPHFFRDRIAIGCNSVYRKFPVQFTVAKELTASDLAESADAGAIPVISRHTFGNKNYPPAIRDLEALHFVFDHPPNRHTAVDWEVIGTDQLVVSYSTITSAIHLAAYMGARLILLCGAETGTLDGKHHYEGYPDADPTPDRIDWYRNFLSDIRAQTITLRDRLREVYDCDVLTLNPFVNFTNENHTFEP